MTPHEKYQLNTLYVQSNRAGTWETISEYRLTYKTPETSRTSDSIDSTTQRQLTLYSVQRFNNDASNQIPATIFEYGESVGTAPFYHPAWNRLTKVENGQGGRVTFTYANTFAACRFNE
ncbi:MAG: hypothetical protein HC780_28100 [Leptolyngbyaceae cyanobacterium CSU_1_3]|nr:hypothetical protein [Leptolyngbyaceae cyanobacterium CSU_1_3]